MRSSKRNQTLEEIAQAEDSDDYDYDDNAPGPSKSRTSRTRGTVKPVRKKQRRGGYRGSDVDSDDEDLPDFEEKDSPARVGPTNPSGTSAKYVLHYMSYCSQHDLRIVLSGRHVR